MRYSILLALAACAFGQSSAPADPAQLPVFPAPKAAPQNRVFQTPDWFKHQFQIDPKNPAAPAPGYTFRPLGNPMQKMLMADAARNGLAKMHPHECVVPIPNAWRQTPGLLFPTPVQNPNFHQSSQGEVVEGLPVCSEKQ